MSNNHEEIAVKRMEKAIRRVLGQIAEKLPSSDPNPTYFRVGTAIAAFVGLSALVGGWSMTYPFILLAIVLVCGVWEIYVQAKRHSWPRKKAAGVMALLFLVIGVSLYGAYDVFKVDATVLFINLANDPWQGTPATSVRLAVQLTNKGRGTGLTDWKAYLTMPDGARMDGNLRELTGEAISIRGANSITATDYSLPECDLGVETARALQNGDSVYGITEFSFPVGIKSIVIDKTTITLIATDVLGRAIKSTPIKLSLNSTPHNFPCPKKNLTKQ